MNALKQDEVLLKAFNNNIILVNSDEKEKILFAKGIGFNKKPGHIIPKGTPIEKIFTIENKDNRNNFKNIVEEVDEEFFAKCEEIIYEISKKCDTELNERIHVGLVDHLYFAVNRLKNSEEIENPFLIETQTLYEREFSLAKIVAEKIREYSNVKIPEGEIGFIALHIHSALNDGKISNTIRNTKISSKIVEYVEKKLNIKIDKKSINYARFCTHVKFAIQRIINNIPSKNDLAGVVKDTYKESYLISEEIAKIIEKELNITVAEDEIAYLTIHIERFRVNN